MGLLKSDWMPNCAMKRIIFHWTVGTHKANAFEKEHYHFLVEGDGTVVRGTHSIKDNVSTVDGDYAAHVKGANTGSIGISACCMAGASESPFKHGSHPMTEVQFKVMAQIAAELCAFYDIPVTKKTVLGHGEVTVNLGIDQSGKWDAMVMPWNTSLSKTEVGDYFRTLVENAMKGEPQEETLIYVKAVVKNQPFEKAILLDGSSFIKIRPVAAALKLELKVRDLDLDLVVAGQPHTMPFRKVGVDGYVSAKDLAHAFGVQPGWDAATRTVIIP